MRHPMIMAAWAYALALAMVFSVGTTSAAGQQPNLSGIWGDREQAPQLLLEITQNEKHIFFAYNNDRSLRHVAMTGSTTAQPGSWAGSWDGNTLVITSADPNNSNQPSITERYTLTGPNSLLQEVSIQGSATPSDMPWVVSVLFYRLNLYRPKGSLTAWETYPSGFSFSRGRPVATLDPNHRYIEVDRRTIPSAFPLFFEDRHYSRIVPVDIADRAASACEHQECWVYLGNNNHWNVEAVALAETELRPPD